jgi:hypothetical protein
MSAAIKFEMTADDFERTNRGLVHLLKAIKEAGKEGIYTRALYAEIRMTGYGDKLVDKAYEDGYILREKKQVPEGKGPWKVFNSLSKKGEKLLAQLG